MSRIAVIGTGYVGLTTGACFAHVGHDVVCADIDPDKVARLQRGEIPILEAGLDNLVREGIDGGRLTFVMGAATAAADCEFAYLCVPTPQAPDGSADLSYIEDAAREIGPVLPSEAIVVNKSTVPVGSTRVVERALGRSDVSVVSNPEFLREGSAIHDFLHPDRIVIGAEDQAAAVRVSSLYLGITAPVIVTDPASAETIKYAANAFLATKISFINAVAAVCEAVGADIKDVALGMGYDSRIGHEFLKPGPGWGGSCFVADDTLLIRRGDRIRLLRFDDLFAEVEKLGADGWEALSWRPGEPNPEFLPISRFTARPYRGDVVDVVTKMGRRITTTADHPFVTTDGRDDQQLARTLGGDLTTSHWLPIAQGHPLLPQSSEPLDLATAVRDKRIPDVAWSAPATDKRALLRGLWDGDGSWSPVASGPSVVLEYGTVSRALADGMVRLLGDLDIVARVKVGRTAKSTVDTYWLTISGADQVERSLFLFPSDEGARIRQLISGQAKRIAPTGYRRLTEKHAAWVRIASVDRRPYSGTVYSLTVPDTHTVVTSFGLVTHQCFPKDTRAMVHIAETAGYDFNLLKGVVAVNDEQLNRVAEKVVELAGGSVDGKRIAAWGLTFKARTDDLRESPSLEVLRRLAARGATVRGYDPSMPGPIDGVEVVDDPYAAVEGAEVLAVLTEWDEFRWLDIDKIADSMAARKVVDARNLLDRTAFVRRGFEYLGIGRS
ncbi:MAG: nucleotide sugar dehydrogenase [Acidimicrobiales bacterium]